MNKATNNSNLIEFLIKPLEEVFGQFDDSTLKATARICPSLSPAEYRQASEKVFKTCKFKPKPAEVYNACVQYQPKLENGNQNGSRAAILIEFAERETKARKMVDSYLRRIESSDTGVLASREGWWPALHQYLFEGARVQARFMCKVPNVGVESVTLSGCTADMQLKEKRMEAFKSDCREAIRNGEINVPIPSWFIEQQRKRPAKK